VAVSGYRELPNTHDMSFEELRWGDYKEYFEAKKLFVSPLEEQKESVKEKEKEKDESQHKSTNSKPGPIGGGVSSFQTLFSALSNLVTPNNIEKPVKIPIPNNIENERSVPQPQKGVVEENSEIAAVENVSDSWSTKTQTSKQESMYKTEKPAEKIKHKTKQPEEQTKKKE